MQNDIKTTSCHTKTTSFGYQTCFLSFTTNFTRLHWIARQQHKPADLNYLQDWQAHLNRRTSTKKTQNAKCCSVEIRATDRKKTMPYHPKRTVKPTEKAAAFKKRLADDGEKPLPFSRNGEGGNLLRKAFDDGLVDNNTTLSGMLSDY